MTQEKDKSRGIQTDPLEQKNDLHRDKAGSDSCCESTAEGNREGNLVDRDLRALGWIVLRFWGEEIKKKPEICVQAIEKRIYFRQNWKILILWIRFLALYNSETIVCRLIINAKRLLMFNRSITARCSFGFAKYE